MIHIKEYRHIFTDFLKIAQQRQDKIQELISLYDETKSDEYITPLFHTIYDLSAMIFSNYGVYIPESRHWICYNLTTELILKIINDENFKVARWFMYLRLAMLHIRDDYRSQVESLGNCKVCSMQEIQLNHHFYKYKLNPVNEEYLNKIYEKAYKKSLQNLAEFLDLREDSPDFYLKFIKMRYSSESYLSRIFDEYVSKNLKEVISSEE